MLDEDRPRRLKGAGIEMALAAGFVRITLVESRVLTGGFTVGRRRAYFPSCRCCR